MDTLDRLENGINLLLTRKSALERQNGNLRERLEIINQENNVLRHENNLLKFLIKREQEARRAALGRVESLLRKIGEYEKVS